MLVYKVYICEKTREENHVTQYTQGKRNRSEKEKLLLYSGKGREGCWAIRAIDSQVSTETVSFVWVPDIRV